MNSGDSVSPTMHNEFHEWLEIALDSIEPLPWRPDSSNNMNRPNGSIYTSSNRSEALVESIDQASQPDHWHHRYDSTSHGIYAPDRFDVVVGRGQAIQRLAGNETYREVVSVNKVRSFCTYVHVNFPDHSPMIPDSMYCKFFVLDHKRIYARCHKNDKGKVSKVRRQGLC